MALHGAVDLLTRRRIAGWAQETETPQTPVRVLIRVDGQPLVHLTASRLRPDLRAAGIGDGRLGFEFEPGGLLPEHACGIAITREDDGALVVPLLALPAAGETGALPPSPLAGRIDQLTHEHIHGWAMDPTATEQPVSLLIAADDVLLARVLAERPRGDLIEAGIGSGGRHGFRVTLHGMSPLRRHVITVRREDDGAHLDGSPAVLAPAQAFDEIYRSQLSALLADITDEALLEDGLRYLAEATDDLVQRHVGRRAQHDERLRRQQVKWRAPGLQSASALRPRALVIDEIVPAPSRDGGSTALLSHMRSLQRIGMDVMFCAADMGLDREGQLRAAGIAVGHAPWYACVEDVLRREAGTLDLVYVHRVTTAARYLALIRHTHPKARLLFSVADLGHLRLRRQAAEEDRPELLELARRYEATELHIAAASDAVLTHSTVEAALLRERLPRAKIHVVPWVVSPQPTATPFAQRHGMAFIGNYAHAPNLDAARFLITEIMPRIQATHPGITCRLVGSGLPESLRQDRPGIQVIGHVPSLAGVFEQVRLTVAPLAYGAGIKGKLLESLAAGVPCACTSIAMEGLAIPRVMAKSVADGADAFAALCIRLHENARFNAAQRAAGLAFVTETLSEAAIDVRMWEAVEGQGFALDPPKAGGLWKP